MTNLSLRSLNLPEIHRFALGFESLFDELSRSIQKNPTYPPYNVLKIDQDQFAIQMAVAGFKEGDIEVQVERNQLIVKGTQSQSEVEPKPQYLYRGISSRSFSLSWPIYDNIKVTNAEMANGILTINFERVVPEEEKPKKIAINYTK